MKLRKAISLFLLLIWCVQLSGRYLIKLNFYMNRAAIAEALCINKDKPQMHCDGLCALKAKLQQEDKKSNESPEKKAESKFEITFFAAEKDIEYNRPAFNNIAQDYPLINSIGHTQDRHYMVFRPPMA